MCPSDKRDDRREALAGLHDVPIVRSGPLGDTSQGWHADVIYRWHGQAIEVWLGPSALGDEGPPACQLRQGTSEVAFLDVGGGRSLSRRTGTVLGELISFEQNRPGFFPIHRPIDIRLAVKQQITIRKRWSSAVMFREDETAIARFKGPKLAIDSDATQAEGFAAMLIHASDILRHLDPPIGWLRANGQYRPL